MSDYIKTGRQEVLEVGVELLDNKIENPGIGDLQNCIMELIKAEQRVKAFTRSVNDLKSRWQNGDLDDSTDVVQVLQHDLQAQEEANVDVNNIWDHEFMVAFVDQMKEIDGGVSLNTGPNSSTSANDMDMQMTQAEMSVKCPITQSDMVDPVKDKTCNHSFEKEAITAHIKQCQKRRKAAKCPYPGCTNIILAGNLEANVAIQRALQRRKVAS
ncbi:E3 SUMO-protein ligase NSE2-like isoform X2 [Clavelina lepadiformis]